MQHIFTMCTYCVLFLESPFSVGHVGLNVVTGVHGVSDRCACNGQVVLMHL